MRDVPTLCVALALAGCNGQAPGSPQTLSCSDFATLATPLGELSNNVWNKQTTGGRPWRQCLEQRSVGTDVQYGWSWQWPPTEGTTVAAYPELVVGSKPWDPGPGNDARFPRRVADTRRFILSYEVETEATGGYNLAASIWLIRTAAVSAPPDPAAVAAEIMVWTESAPAAFVPAGTKRAEVAIDGIGWEVWAAENWGDSAGLHANRWTYVVYRARTPTRTARYDARKLMADAIGRGLISAELYIADVELGNEIVSGSGRTWIKRFSVTID